VAEILTLIICTVGRTEPLRRLLLSLRAQTDRRFTAIVVDQNPPGFLAPILAEFSDLPLQRLESPPGLSRARNVGIAAAKGELIGFPDDDCWYRPGTVAEVIGRFEAAPDTDVLTGRTVDAEATGSPAAPASGERATDSRGRRRPARCAPCARTERPWEMTGISPAR
jgi:glycosyltransferase involved in cell wall biosynthesis